MLVLIDTRMKNSLFNACKTIVFDTSSLSIKFLSVRHVFQDEGAAKILKQNKHLLKMRNFFDFASNF